VVVEVTRGTGEPGCLLELSEGYPPSHLIRTDAELSAGQIASGILDAGLLAAGLPGQLDAGLVAAGLLVAGLPAAGLHAVDPVAGEQAADVGIAASLVVAFQAAADSIAVN
jgi:hypothetical protein